MAEQVWRRLMCPTRLVSRLDHISWFSWMKEWLTQGYTPKICWTHILKFSTGQTLVLGGEKRKNIFRYLWRKKKYINIWKLLYWSEVFWFYFFRIFDLFCLCVLRNFEINFEINRHKIRKLALDVWLMFRCLMSVYCYKAFVALRKNLDHLGCKTFPHFNFRALMHTGKLTKGKFFQRDDVKLFSRAQIL